MKPKSISIYLSRSSQAADYLRQQIRAGQWKNHLPAERVLSEQMAVSRRTIRAALDEMQQEGWILERTRQGTRIQVNSNNRSETRTSVGLLLPYEIDKIRHRTILWMDDLRRMLHIKHIDMHVYCRRVASPRAELTMFRRVIEETSHGCWVLPNSRRPVQEWCAKHSFPAVFVGTLFEKNPLPHVEFDYRASCQHAVAQMVRMGHRSIVFILSEQERGGDAVSRVAFRDTAEKFKDKSIKSEILYHDETVQGICRVVDRLLHMNSTPTAWLVAEPAYFLSVLTHLQQRGIKIPSEISLICRDADPYLASCVPEPTRYVFNIQSQAKHISRLVQKVLHGQPVNQSSKILPELIQGQTLGPFFTGDNPAE